MKPLIQIDSLHYSPSSAQAEQPEILHGINLAVEEGAFIAIIGENGSGKTTLIKHINGLLLPTSGQVLVNGLDTRQPKNRAQIQSMVGMVFQNPADQIVASTVEEDIAFGLENINLPTPELRRRVAVQLDAAGLTGEAERPPHLLSGGQIQMVALAGVLARQPRVILFDEPTSMLDPYTRIAFMKRLRALHQAGMTIIYITHHMEEAVHADQVVVMHTGSIAHIGSPMEIFWNGHNLHEIGLELPETVKIARKMHAFGVHFDSPVLTEHALLEALPTYAVNVVLRPPKPEVGPGQPGAPFIDLDNVHYTYLSGSPLAKKALNGADLEVSQGEIFALAGANGSGKSTLLQHINGILRAEHGRVQVGEFSLEDPQTAIREVIRKVGLVFQNPETQFFEVFVGDEIAYGPKQFGMDDLRDRVQAAMEMVGLDFEAFKDRRLDTLSGGEKRKVALASTLVLEQDVLMFDEPSAGMDPHARDELLDLFIKLQARGKTLIIASHRMEELVAISDQLALMEGGRVIQTGLCGEVMSNFDLIGVAGLVPPLAIRVAQVLAEKGWPINPADICSLDNLCVNLEDVTS